MQVVIELPVLPVPIVAAAFFLRRCLNGLQFLEKLDKKVKNWQPEKTMTLRPLPVPQWLLVPGLDFPTPAAPFTALASNSSWLRHPLLQLSPLPTRPSRPLRPLRPLRILQVAEAGSLRRQTPHSAARL